MSKKNCGEFSPLENKKKGGVATHRKDFHGKNRTK
jgi:hypothetical protein